MRPGNCLILLLVGVGCTALAATSAPTPPSAPETPSAGFAEEDITPPNGNQPIYLAGFGRNRTATGVHDRLHARAIVLRHGAYKVALVAVDLIGLFRDEVEAVRRQLPGFSYVLVASTHTHSGPDTLGLWGPDAATGGVDPSYLQLLTRQVVKAVLKADAAARPVEAWVGSARDADLLHDSREPYVKHDELVVLRLKDPTRGCDVGLVVQWNCHPETLGARNRLVSADFLGATVNALRQGHRCPVIYFSGTVGGLMTSMHVPVRDEQGKRLAEESFEKTDRYGQLIAQLAEGALRHAHQVRLTPLEARAREVFLPLDNPLYQLARALGVLNRPAFRWAGNSSQASAALPGETGRLCLRSEVACLQLGELQIACLPGEIYPELVLGKVQDPPDPGADFPQAPAEPAIYAAMPSPYRMMIGLANDEIGYIIPKRQWDQRPPFCYGRKNPQYGEQNSLGPETAPVVCGAFHDLVAGRGRQAVTPSRQLR